MGNIYIYIYISRQTSPSRDTIPLVRARIFIYPSSYTAPSQPVQRCDLSGPSLYIHIHPCMYTPPSQSIQRLDLPCPQPIYAYIHIGIPRQGSTRTQASPRSG